MLFSREKSDISDAFIILLNGKKSNTSYAHTYSHFSLTSPPFALPIEYLFLNQPDYAIQNNLISLISIRSS
jgi:hypothetical protein